MKPSVTYLICATHRSGSTLLCEALKNTGLAGFPEEYFWRDNDRRRRREWGSKSYAAYLTHLFEHRTSANGVFGAKIMWGHLPRFANKLKCGQVQGHAETVSLLTAAFPNLHFIIMTRRNKVRQAISLYRAVSTKKWSSFLEPERPASPKYNMAVINHWYQELLRHERGWRRFFNTANVTPYEVVYETFAPTYETTALNILKSLGIETPQDIKFGPRYLERQADNLTNEWEQRFRRETL